MYELHKDSTFKNLHPKLRITLYWNRIIWKLLKIFFIGKLINKADDFERKRSGWCLNEIRFLELIINKCEPLRGSSYIDLPENSKSKKAILNVKNKDDNCFMWSILFAIHPVEKNPQRVSKYEKY